MAGFVSVADSQSTENIICGSFSNETILSELVGEVDQVQTHSVSQNINVAANHIHHICNVSSQQNLSIW